jgi:hypothetical protein
MNTHHFTLLYVLSTSVNAVPLPSFLFSPLPFPNFLFIHSLSNLSPAQHPAPLLATHQTTASTHNSLDEQPRHSRSPLHQLFFNTTTTTMSSSSAYANWDRELATQRALNTADTSTTNCTTDDGKHIYNFAFGSNLNPSKVKTRNMYPVTSCRGVLRGWQLLFNHNGGYGNIEETSVVQQENMDLSPLCGGRKKRKNSARSSRLPEEVHGVLLQLTREEFGRLAWEEYAYNTIEVPIEVYSEDTKEVAIQYALAFKTAECAVTTSTTLPSKRYIKLIQQGARASGIQESYCEWLEGIPHA